MTTPGSRETARGIALTCLARVREGAYANLALPALLSRSSLDERDRRFATDLTYGSVRMQRACDFLVDRFLFRTELDPDVRDALRLGAYQLHYLGIPAHAAVGETVNEVPGRARGLVNAVLRKVAAAGPDVVWPDQGTQLSYPDWILRLLSEDLGEDVAVAALSAMNEAAAVHQRDDGYVQDPASTAVAEYAGATAGQRVADVCAAPGGKATALAHHAGKHAIVVAADIHPARAKLVRDNARATGTVDGVAVVVADARRPPHAPATFDTVLVDAPCSGLGVLRRRPDARWRIQSSDVADLAALQRQILEPAIGLLRPGGRLVYSVCTLTRAETTGIDEWLANEYPTLVADVPPPDPWLAVGRGAMLLPQTAGTDGMYVLGLTNAPQPGR